MAIQSLNRPKSLYELTLENIRSAIINGDISFGEKVSELSLSKKLGISKTPIREAFKELRRQGLLRIDPQRGTFVFLPTEDEINQLYSFRSLLESGAAELAIQSHRQAVVAEMEKVVTQMQRPDSLADSAHYADLDSQFHNVIVNGSQNRYLIEAYQPVSFQIDAILARNVKSEHVIERSAAVHLGLLNTLKDGDGRAFISALLEHLEQSHRDCLDWLSKVDLGVEAGAK